MKRNVDMPKCKYCGKRASVREPFETAEQPYFINKPGERLVRNPNCPMVWICTSAKCADAHWEAKRVDPVNGPGVAAVEYAFEQDRLRCLAGEYGPEAKARAEKERKQR